MLTSGKIGRPGGKTGRRAAIAACLCSAGLFAVVFAAPAQGGGTFSMNATSLQFGNYMSGSLSNGDATSTITITDTTAQPYSLAANAGTGSGATLAARRMTRNAAADTLDYTLYLNPSRTTVWGDGTNGTSTILGTGTGSAQNYTVYARIPASQGKPVGDYTDTITVTAYYGYEQTTTRQFAVTAHVNPDKDLDGDGFLNSDDDNCPGVANPDQLDADNDGVGDACDYTPDDADTDIDDDGVSNAEDNCPETPNMSQLDTDGDDRGDACDAYPNDGADTDTDGDGDLNDVDNCPGTANADQVDTDSDGRGDACDVYPDDPTNTSFDTDGDAVLDKDDNCIDVPNTQQEDSDADAIGDACDECPDDETNTCNPPLPTCQGIDATIVAVPGVPVVGTPGRDVIVGTSGDDEINGGGGPDLVCALGGEDSVRGKEGGDELHGGAGPDTLRGYTGEDTLFGDEDADELRGGKGADALDGGTEVDSCRGGGTVHDTAANCESVHDVP